MTTFLNILNTIDPGDQKGLEFEKLSRWILTKHPLYFSRFKKVWLWNDWPNKWGQDCGIDIIAEEHSGKVWAIQAKCYNPNYYITKSDIDKFLSESTNNNIHYRLLIASTDRIGKNARSVMDRQNDVIPVSTLLLSDLIDAPISWPEKIENLDQGSAIKSYSPRPHQRKAINKVCKQLDDRGQLVMACGTGKTLTALWISEKVRSETTLVLLPSLLLLSKTLIEWVTHSKISFSYLPVCSDRTVTKSEDPLRISNFDLSFPTTTSSKEIFSFLQSPGRKVIFSTYQSSEKIAEAFKENKLKPINLIIADEAHRCAGNIDSTYSTILSDNLVPAEKRLFMTATPKIFKKNFMKAANAKGIDISSMDDKKIFGPVLHKLSFAEAIHPSDGSEPLLSDYRVSIIGIDNKNYFQMINKRTLVKTTNDMQTDAKSLASIIGLAKALKVFDLKRVITFHTRKEYARNFSNFLPKVIEWMPSKYKPKGKIITDFVTGDMPTDKRNKSLKAIEDISANQKYVLSNAKCLSEGVDVPALDGIAFIDPRNSEIDIVQAVGRAIRLSKEKTIGTIVIPVFIKEHEDPDEVINSSEFKRVWSVINALRSHDEGLGDQLDQIRRSLGKKTVVGNIEKIFIDLPETISNKFSNALKIKIVENTTSIWEFWFGLMQDFIKENGHATVNTKYKTKNGFKLGKWALRQRHEKKSLTKDRIEKLDSIGFIWNPYEALWEEHFQELKLFKKMEGDCLVPIYFTTSNGIKLGSWVRSQRNSKTKMQSSRKAKLDLMGFIWDVDEYKWDLSFNELLKYKELFGDTNVKRGYQTSFGTSLYTWALKQGAHFDDLSNKKKKSLRDIGFITHRKAEIWDINFNALQMYKKKFGNCIVPHDYVTESNVNLGKWLSTIRGKRKHLSKEKIKRLSALGFIWNLREYKWEENFQELLKFKKQFGDCNVPDNYISPSGFSLGVWVSKLISRKNTLSKNRLRRLNEIGFIWSRKEKLWEDKFKELVKYKKQYGNCHVPSKYQSNGINLGRWVEHLKKRKNTLSKEQIYKLKKLGF